MRQLLRLSVASMVALAGCAFPSMASNTNLSTTYSNGGCAGLECNSRTVVGSVVGRNVGQTFAVKVAIPWVAQFWAENNECFRLTATKLEAGGNNLRMVLIAPDGLVIRRTIGSGAEHWIVVANPSSQFRTGMWTVIVTNGAGDASEHEFNFTFGRYFVGNTDNCTGVNAGDPNTYWVR